jgi:uncharacterized RDD family membrane protein YckC
MHSSIQHPLLRLALTLLLAGSSLAQEPAPPPPTAPSEVPAVTPPVPDPAPPTPRNRRSSRDIIRTGVDVVIAAGEEAHDIVVVGADLIVEGEVSGDVVVVGGTARIRGRVDGDVVNVGRGLWVENGGLIEGDAIGVGGGIVREDGATIRGHIGNYGAAALPRQQRDRIMLFLNECVLLGRPLSFKVGWVWMVWLTLLLLHALLAVMLPGATQATLRTMRERPGGTALLGLLGLPLILLTTTLIAATGIGLLAVPFMLLGTVFILAIGRVALLRLLGGRILATLGMMSSSPAAEFFIGAILLTALFLVPFLGVITWMTFFLWALGGALMALFRRDPRPTPVAPATTLPGQTQSTAPDPVSSPGMVGFAAASAACSNPSIHPDPIHNPAPPPDPIPPRIRPWSDADILSAPRPGMGRRLLALVIDWLPILALAALIPDRLFGVRLDDHDRTLRVMLGVAYYTWMLTRRSTTLGGMVMGLRVVRLDGRPMNRDVALVRALSAILSLLSLGIGWFWVAWDERRQAWHDRLAGTVVIRDDNPPPLV